MKEKEITNKYALSEKQQKDLFNGEVPEEHTDLEKLSDDLRQVKEITDQKQAYITAITPPSVSAPSEPPTDKYNISVKFAIKEDTAFWKSYDYSDEQFTESHPFSEILQYLGYNVENLQRSLGEPVPIKYKDGSWDLDTEKISKSIDNQDRGIIDLLDEQVENMKTYISEQVHPHTTCSLFAIGLAVSSFFLTYIVLSNAQSTTSSITEVSYSTIFSYLMMVFMYHHIVFIVISIVLGYCLFKFGELFVYLFKKVYNRLHQTS